METIDLQIPTKWEDITASQLKLIAKMGVKAVTREEFLLMILCKITGLKVEYIPEGYEDNLTYCFRKKKQLLFIPIYVVVDACSRLSFLIDSVGMLSSSPIKGISNKLYGISFERYYHADALIPRFQLENKKKYLHRAISALTGRRSYFISQRKAYIIIIWWNGIREFLRKEYPFVFSDGEATDKTPAEILLQILSAVNNDSPQENKSILATDLHSVLISLNNKYKAYANHTKS